MSGNANSGRTKSLGPTRQSRLVARQAAEAARPRSEEEQRYILYRHLLTRVLKSELPLHQAAPRALELQQQFLQENA